MRQWLAESRCECQTGRAGRSGETLSDGRQSVSFRIAPVAGALEAWAILEPRAPLTVVVGRTVAVDTRSGLDTLIA